MAARTGGSVCLLALGLLAVAGCQSPGPVAGSPGLAGGAGDTEMATGAREREGGLLLRTGAIQLGPGVGRNAWRWQGDGLWGF